MTLNNAWDIENTSDRRNIRDACRFLHINPTPFGSSIATLCQGQGSHAGKARGHFAVSFSSPPADLQLHPPTTQADSIRRQCACGVKYPRNSGALQVQSVLRLRPAPLQIHLLDPSRPTAIRSFHSCRGRSRVWKIQGFGQGSRGMWGARPPGGGWFQHKFCVK